MKEIRTKFGPLYIDELDAATHDDTHINLYDSNGNYLDYVDADTLAYLAETNGTSIDEEYDAFCEKIAGFDKVSELLDYICYSWDCISDDLNDIVKVFNNDRHVGETTATVLDNEFVNQIGRFYVLLTEC